MLYHPIKNIHIQDVNLSILLYNQHINKYLRYDPTLRRIKDNIIKCPNKECDVEPEKEQILYIKYHPNNMKYLYVCDHCGYIWRTGKE